MLELNLNIIKLITYCIKNHNQIELKDENICPHIREYNEKLFDSFDKL